MVGQSEVRQMSKLVPSKVDKLIKNGMYVYYQECSNVRGSCRNRCWSDSTGTFYCDDPVRRVMECGSIPPPWRAQAA